MLRSTYIIETEDGQMVTAIRNEDEAREAGEKLAEFDPATPYYLTPVTLQ